MKEERMAVLRMLEKGIITASEAERLLLALQEGGNKGPDTQDDISANINSALSKAGEILETFVQTVGEKAEDAAKEMEPIIKKVKETVSEKAEDVKIYAEKVKKDILEEREKSKRAEEKDPQADVWAETPRDARADCDLAAPCCGLEEICEKKDPCCAEENICKKEETCCGIEETACQKLTPCCWTKDPEEMKAEMEAKKAKAQEKQE